MRQERFDTDQFLTVPQMPKVAPDDSTPTIAPQDDPAWIAKVSKMDEGLEGKNLSNEGSERSQCCDKSNDMMSPYQPHHHLHWSI